MGQRQKIESAENRLTHDEKLCVMQWFVELRSTYEISDLIKQEFDKDITPQAIWRYKNSKKWRPVIARLRKRYEKNLLEIPIANKKDRLRYLQKVVIEGFKWSLKTITKDGDEIYELKLSSVTQAIKEAREEVEPKISGPSKANQNVNIYIVKPRSDGSPRESADTGSRIHIQRAFSAETSQGIEEEI